MIKKLLFAVFILLNLSAFAQEEEAINVQAEPQAKLSKSESLRNAGWVLLGVGLTSVTVGRLLMEKNARNNDKVFGFGNNFESEVTFFVGGIILSTASVPFFISASKHKRNERAAASASIKIESIDHSSIVCVYSYYPSIALKVRF